MTTMFAISILCALTTLLLAQIVPDDDSSQKNACMIKGLAGDRNLTLSKEHSSVENDNAYAYNNIEDVCNGKSASRSTYTCKACEDPAPGGSTDLSSKLLQYIIEASARTKDLFVNEIAGGCHECKSKHYEGKAVEIDRLKLSDKEDDKLVALCNKLEGKGMKEGDHVHCQFP